MPSWVLSENRALRFAALSALYAAQGIPDAMVLIVFPAFLAANGASAAAVGGFLAVAMLPNAAKLLAGPAIDRFSFLPMGRRRPWVMFGEVLIAASFLFLATITDPVAQLPLFTAGAFAVTLATVFQDVATDGMAMDTVPAAEQGRANGIMWGSKTLGTAAAASGGAIVLAKFGFAALALTAAAVLLAVLVLVVLLRERAGERRLPWTAGEASAHALAAQPANWNAIFAQLYRAVQRPAATRLIGVSVCIGLSFGLAGALLPVLMVQDFGWDDAAYSQVRSSLKLVAGIAGMVAGGYLIDRLGHRLMLGGAFASLGVAHVAMALSLEAQPGLAYMAAYEMLLVFIFITFFAATMKQCWRSIAASQFSFTMVCGNIALAGGAALLGPLSEAAGYRGVLFALAVFAAVAAIIGARIRFDACE